MHSVFDDLHKGRRLADWFGLAYVLTTAWFPLLHPSCFDVLADPGPLQTPLGHLALHLAVAAAVFVAPPLLRRRAGLAGRVLGLVYLPLLFGVFYGEIEYLGVVFRDYGQSFDPVIIDLEQALFGMQPSLAWSRAWAWPWLLELMQFAYFSYYFFPVIGLSLIWLASGRSRDDRWAMSEGLVRDLVAVMLSCYLWYIVFPVWGPKYFDYLGMAGPVASEGLHGYLFTDIMHWIDSRGALHGAAFPSSHVAGSMVSWWWGWKAAPRHRWWLTTLWALLGLSIVYARYHYALDLLGGVAWGAFVMTLTARLGRPVAPGCPSIRHEPDTERRPPVGRAARRVVGLDAAHGRAGIRRLR